MENNGLYREDQAIRLNVALYMGEEIRHSRLEEDRLFQLVSKHSFHRVACINSCTSYFVTYQSEIISVYVDRPSADGSKAMKLGLFSVGLSALKETVQKSSKKPIKPLISYTLCLTNVCFVHGSARNT